MVFEATPLRDQVGYYNHLATGTALRGCAAA